MVAYTIAGAGAIGGWLSAHLASRGCAVTVVDPDRDHVAAISSLGIALRHPDGTEERRIGIDARLPEELGDERLARVVLATKSHRIDGALDWVAPRLSDDGTIVVCQNGQGYRRVADRVGEERVVPALINFAADRVEPGVIRIGGPGTMALGEIDGSPSGRVERLCDDFAGFPGLRRSGNIVGLLWSKAVLGVLLTATALDDDDISRVIERRRGTMIRLARETIAIASDVPVRFEEFDGIDWSRFQAQPEGTIDAVLRYLATVPGKTRSGVFRDLEAGRTPTEASAELEALLAQADAAGIAAPTIGDLRDRLGDAERRRALHRGAPNTQSALRTSNPIERRS